MPEKLLYSYRLMNRFNELKYRYKYSSPVMKLIAVNAVVFVLALLINLSAFLFFKSRLFTAPYLSLPSDPAAFISRSWTLITYQFTHFGAFHFLFNMLVLYFSGLIFHDFFRKNDLWKVYILGGTAAAFLFIVSAVYIPAFSGSTYTLVGASGSIMAVMFAAVIYAPDLRLQLFGVFPVKFKWLAIAYVLMDLISISESNAGGHIAHLGGALFGTLFALFRKGHLRLSLFEPVLQRKPFAKVQKNEVKQAAGMSSYTRKSSEGSGRRTPSQEEIDAILDKISKSGYDRLSKEEKEILFKASQE